MSAAIVFTASLFASIQRDNLNGAIVGLSVVYALRVGIKLYLIVSSV